MTLLHVDRLSKTFGGIHAIEDLSFTVPRGAIHAVIGPNGAGKTTLFNMVTGLYRPSAGRVRLGDRDITAHPPHELARLGMSRTFQNLQVCMNMTAIENVMLGRHLHMDSRVLPALLRLPGLVRGERACREAAVEMLDFVGIGRYAQERTDSLSYGVLKRLEIARGLAAKPTLLLLDEPAAGLNPSETGEIGTLIRRIATEGVTVLLVEHDMKLVMRLAEQVVVLDYGKKIGEGTPAQVRANPNVIAAYLGGKEKRPGEP